MAVEKRDLKFSPRVGFGLVSWLGGAFWTAHQPGMGFWDGLVWMYYVGRYAAAHFTLLAY